MVFLRFSPNHLLALGTALPGPPFDCGPGADVEEGAGRQALGLAQVLHVGNQRVVANLAPRPVQTSDQSGVSASRFHSKDASIPASKVLSVTVETVR